jgi:hypothetical protein
VPVVDRLRHFDAVPAVELVQLIGVADDEMDGVSF